MLFPVLIQRQRTFTVGGMITVRLVSRLTRFDLTKYKICGYLYVDNKAVESILLKLETSCTVILPSMASVLCPSTSSTYVLFPRTYLILLFVIK